METRNLQAAPIIRGGFFWFYMSSRIRFAFVLCLRDDLVGNSPYDFSAYQNHSGGHNQDSVSQFIAGHKWDDTSCRCRIYNRRSGVRVSAIWKSVVFSEFSSRRHLVSLPNPSLLQLPQTPKWAGEDWSVTFVRHGSKAAFQIRLRKKERVISYIRANHMITSQLSPGFGRLQRRHQAGMTLVEVVVAMAITGMAVGGIVNGYNYCTNSAQKAALMLAANARAMERIEETRSAIWAPDRSPAVDQLVAANFPSKGVTLDLPGSGVLVLPATILTEVSQVSVNPPLKRIRVDCIWQFQGVQWVTNTIETCRASEQ